MGQIDIYIYIYIYEGERPAAAASSTYLTPIYKILRSSMDMLCLYYSTHIIGYCLVIVYDILSLRLDMASKLVTLTNKMVYMLSTALFAN